MERYNPVYWGLVVILFMNLTTLSASTTACQKVWEQCGGKEWTGFLFFFEIPLLFSFFYLKDVLLSSRSDRMLSGVHMWINQRLLQPVQARVQSFSSRFMFCLLAGKKKKLPLREALEFHFTNITETPSVLVWSSGGGVEGRGGWVSVPQSFEGVVSFIITVLSLLSLDQVIEPVVKVAVFL